VSRSLEEHVNEMMLFDRAEIRAERLAMTKTKSYDLPPISSSYDSLSQLASTRSRSWTGRGDALSLLWRAELAMAESKSLTDLTTFGGFPTPSPPRTYIPPPTSSSYNPSSPLCSLTSSLTLSPATSLMLITESDSGGRQQAGADKSARRQRSLSRFIKKMLPTRKRET
jgi:hypothetical protein